MANRPKSRLGELLLDRKVVTKKQLNKALKRQQEQGALLGSILVDMGVLSEELLKTFLAEQCQVPNLDLATVTPSHEALERISREVAITEVALPLSLDGRRLTVVMGDPLDASAVEALKEETGCDIDPVFAPGESIQEAIGRWYEGLAAAVSTEDASPTLQGFEVASENERAFKSALRVAHLEAAAPNPLILVGPTGSGKSHLLRGIRSEMLSRGRGLSVFLLGCAGADDNTAAELAKSTGEVDHLLVDDLDQLAGNEALERATLAAVNAVFARRGKVVLTSSKRPQELRKLSPGLLLSLGLGSVVEIGPVSVSPPEPPAPKEEEEPPAEAPEAAEVLEGMRDEAEAIIQEARMALDDVRSAVGEGVLENELEEAELLWQESKVSFERGEHERAEALGMEALEKAALLQRQLAEGGGRGGDAAPKSGVGNRVDEVRKLLQRAAKAGAEEYAAKEMKTAAALVEEAEVELGAGKEAAAVLEKLEKAAQSAGAAEKKARKYRDQDRLRQEEEKRRRARHAVAKLDETVSGLEIDDLGVRLESHVEDLKAVIQSATAYLDADNYGQALELALDGRRMADELLEKIGQRRELRQIVKQVDDVLRSGDLRTSNDPWVGQQLVEVQNALSEAERVLLGDSEDYALGLNWARVAQQKAAKLVGREAFDRGEHEVVKVKKPSKIRLRKRFAGFATGECNRFAYSVARAAAENPQSIRSPLYIYGDIGTGKTHLLSAIMAAVEESSRERAVVFVSADDFLNEFRAAEERAELEAFRNRYRTPDLLLVDDIQYLVEHEREARELLHTLGAIERTGGLVIATADRPPREIGGLSSGLRSRLEGGVIARLRPPDLETRKLMLRMEAKKEGLELSDDVVELLANLVDTNPRDLLGMYGKVVAYSRVTERPIDAALIEEALQEVLSAGRRYAGGRE